jgi:hypothetical protein
MNRDRLWALLDPARAQDRFEDWKASLAPQPKLEVSQVPTPGQLYQVPAPELGLVTTAPTLPEPLDRGDRVRVAAPCGDFDATVKQAQRPSDDGRVFVTRSDNGRILFVRREHCTPVPEATATPADSVPKLQRGDRVHVHTLYHDFEGTLGRHSVEGNSARVRSDDNDKIYFVRYSECTPISDVLLPELDRKTAIELAKRLRNKCQKISRERDRLESRLLESQTNPAPTPESMTQRE